MGLAIRVILCVLIGNTDAIMQTQYYSISLIGGEHLGFLLTVLEGEDGSDAHGQALIKIQPAEAAWLARPETVSLQELADAAPLYWHCTDDAVVLCDADGTELTRTREGCFKWRGELYLVNDISSVI